MLGDPDGFERVLEEDPAEVVDVGAPHAQNVSAGSSRLPHCEQSCMGAPRVLRCGATISHRREILAETLGTPATSDSSVAACPPLLRRSDARFDGTRDAALQSAASVRIA